MFDGRLLAACLALTLLAACGEPNGGPAPGPPKIGALDLTGKQVRLSDFLGQVLVLNFWSGGCGPCIAEMPRLDSVHRQYARDGLAVLGINQGEEPKEVAATIERLGIGYPIAIDQLGISAKRYNVSAVPATFVLDREGEVRERVLGEISRERLEGMVTPLLGVEASSALLPASAGLDRQTPAANAPAGEIAVARLDPSGGNIALGEALYRNRCRDCHGHHAEKPALGRAEPLRDLPAERVLESLRGYRYSAPSTPAAKFKSDLSDREIQDLVAYLQEVKSDREIENIPVTHN